MKKNTVCFFIILISFWLCAWAQDQYMGYFRLMDGGFEDQAVGPLPPGGMNTTNPEWRYWIEDVGFGVICETGGRSGPHYVHCFSSTANTSALVSHGTLDFVYDVASNYIIQFWYQGDLDGTPGTMIGGLLYDASPPIGSGHSEATLINPNVGYTWTKYAYPAGLPARPQSNGSGFIMLWGIYDINIDDFVIYPGSTPDITPPDPPQITFLTPTSHTTRDLAWAFPLSGLDGGGSMVVRYSTHPGPGDNPVQNGIYDFNDPVGSSGIVIYVGIGSDCSDGVDIPMLPNTQYWYRIYTVDKAFNYSVPAEAEIQTTPVELSSFNAVVTSDYLVNLTWVTQTETEVSGYNVYRSDNAIAPEYMVNNNLIPATNTSTQQTYNFIDSENLQMNRTYFYWLENVDLSGITNMYGPVSVTLSEPSTPPPTEVSTLKNTYPNPIPSGGSAHIEVDIKAGETGTVIIYNLRGQKVAVFNNLKNSQTLSWNVDGCASGLYLCKLTSPSAFNSRKLLIVK